VPSAVVPAPYQRAVRPPTEVMKPRKGKKVDHIQMPRTFWRK